VERIPARVRLLHSTTATAVRPQRTKRGARCQSTAAAGAEWYRQVAPCCNLLRPHRSPRGAGNSLETYST
jgi:phage tail tape-measure protein